MFDNGLTGHNEGRHAGNAVFPHLGPVAAQPCRLRLAGLRVPGWLPQAVRGGHFVGGQGA